MFTLGGLEQNINYICPHEVSLARFRNKIIMELIITKPIDKHLSNKLVDIENTVRHSVKQNMNCDVEFVYIYSIAINNKHLALPEHKEEEELICITKT